jgi:tetratricopeptide (TPR) repeat protein
MLRELKDQIMNEDEINGAFPELSNEVLTKIDALSESGNDCMDEEDFDGAVASWEEALALIPEPQNHYIQSVWLNASIGDAYFLQDDFETALTYFLTAKSNVEENVYSNPFIMLRLGECYLEQGDQERAKEFLLRAYLLDPEEIFEGEDEKYLDFLSSNVNLKEQP